MSDPTWRQTYCSIASSFIWLDWKRHAGRKIVGDSGTPAIPGPDPNSMEALMDVSSIVVDGIHEASLKYAVGDIAYSPRRVCAEMDIAALFLSLMNRLSTEISAASKIRLTSTESAGGRLSTAPSSSSTCPTLPTSVSAISQISTSKGHSRMSR